MTAPQTPSTFRLAYVAGVTPSKWVRIWHERLPQVPLELVPVTAAEAFGMLRDGGEGGVDAGFVRLPVDGADLSAIPLYTETTVVVVPKDHLLAAADEVSAADLADDVMLRPLDDVVGWEDLPGEPAKERPATTADAVELVAAGIGLLVVPQSLARLHHRRDLTYRPVTDAPQSRVALSWPQDATTDLVEHLIGIVRGRTVNSTRGKPLPSGAEDQRKARTTAKGRDGARAGGKNRDKGQGAGRSGTGSASRSGAAPRSGSGSGSGGGKGRGRGGKPRRHS
ncbi:LysR family substrate-binding domain-containing protein [Actinacidiphila alni]|uniref:LysR family substrate-binding domain-containing protein n=1 Tax=Actinacidiphila alni TaxID=380248 RepID=UPI0033DF2DBB